MAITGIRYRPFRLPMRAPMQTARAAIAYRAGVVVELTDASGLRGVGEASPLPEFGEGDADDVLRLIEERGADLLGGIPDGPGAPALRCALDVARLDLEGKQRGLSVAALLTEHPRASVAANAVISDGPPDVALAQVREAWAAGFRTFKLKVAARPPDDDVRRVQAIREALPDARLRLDANGGWDERTAAATLARLAACNVELVEQPVPVGADEALARIHRESSTASRRTRASPRSRRAAACSTRAPSARSCSSRCGSAASGPRSPSPVTRRSAASRASSRRRSTPASASRPRCTSPPRSPPSTRCRTWRTASPQRTTSPPTSSPSRHDRTTARSPCPHCRASA